MSFVVFGSTDEKMSRRRRENVPHIDLRTSPQVKREKEEEMSLSLSLVDDKEAFRSNFDPPGPPRARRKSAARRPSQLCTEA